MISSIYNQNFAVQNPYLQTQKQNYSQLGPDSSISNDSSIFLNYFNQNGNGLSAGQSLNNQNFMPAEQKTQSNDSNLMMQFFMAILPLLISRKETTSADQNDVLSNQQIENNPAAKTAKRSVAEKILDPAGIVSKDKDRSVASQIFDPLDIF